MERHLRVNRPALGQALSPGVRGLHARCAVFDCRLSVLLCMEKLCTVVHAVSMAESTAICDTKQRLDAGAFVENPAAVECTVQRCAEAYQGWPVEERALPDLSRRYAACRQKPPR